MNNCYKYGILSEDSTACEKYTDEELNVLRYARYNLKKQMVYSKNNIITTLVVHPVDRLCYGSCPYCYNNSYEYDKNFGFLSLERYENFLSFIQNKLADDVTTEFIGGNCFLYKDIYSLIDVSKKYIKNLNIRFYADMIHDEETHQNTLKVFDRLIYDSDVKSVSMHITTDYGSNTRYSTYLNLSNETVNKRAEKIVEKYGKYKKFRIIIKVNINKETDKDILLYNIDNMVNKKCFILYNPVRDLNYSPNIKHLEDIVYSIENNFDTKIYWKEMIIANNLSKEKIKNNKMFYHLFAKTKKGDYVYNPYYFDCPGYINSTGISSKTYLPCFIGYLEENSIEDTLIYNHTENEEHYKNFLTLPEECHHCDMLSVCMRCMVRRHLLPCSKIPSLKWWEEFIWKKKCEEKDFHVYI